MSEQYTPNAETWALLDAACCDDLDADQAERLETALRADERFRDFYLDYFQLHAELTRSVRLEQVRENIVESIRQPKPSLSEQPIITNERSSFPSFSFSPLPSPSSPPFVGGPVFSYMVATVVLCMMILGGWLYKTTSDTSVVDGRKTTPVEEQVPQLAGWVSGMVDCEWTDGDAVPFVGSSVWFGRKYAFKSGLMEITYKSGARVILEGPCNYSVDSAAGGFLAMGKLTARVEKNDELRIRDKELKRQETDIHHSSFTTHHLFCVRTPTAVVTDLGTEFGVEVSENGTTEAHVVQGKVDVRASAISPDGKTNHVCVTEGNAVCVYPRDKTVSSVPYSAGRFVRHVTAPPDTRAEDAYIKAVLAGKPLGYWPLNEPAGARKFIDHSGNGFHGDAIGPIRAGVSGPLPGQSRAVEFERQGYIDLGRQDRFALPNGFTVEAWVWIDGAAGRHGMHILDIQNGGRHRRFGWFLSGDQPEPTIDDSGQNNALRCWLHVACVIDKDGSGRSFCNGELIGSIPPADSLRNKPTWCTIGLNPDTTASSSGKGRLAHVVIYPKILNEQQIIKHYRLSVKGEK